MTRLQQDMERAAVAETRIQDLESEVERLVDGWKDEAMAKDAEIAALRAALMPFAQMAALSKSRGWEPNPLSGRALVVLEAQGVEVKP